jgi:proteasome accessory factor C
MAKTTASDRARRLLALTGHLTKDARLSIATLAEALGTTPAELADDFVALSMCGTGDLDPWSLVPVMVEDGFVEVWGEMPALRGRVRLSATEAAALAAALQAAGFSADDPLVARILSATSTDFDAHRLEQTVRAAISTHDTSVFETLARATRDAHVVRLEYGSAGSAETTVRDIEPRAVFAERGAWYVTAWCRLNDAWRTFRIDRIRSAEPTGAIFDAVVRGSSPENAPGFGLKDSPVARLSFTPGEAFTLREWPGARLVSSPGADHVEIEVPYSGLGWISRQVVARLGAVRVVEPIEVRDAVATLANELSASMTA